MRTHNLVEDRALFVERLLLLIVITVNDIRAEFQRARVLREHAADYLCQGGFAAAVGTENENPVVLFHGEAYIREDALFSVAFCEMLGVEHIVSAFARFAEGKFYILWRGLRRICLFHAGKRLFAALRGDDIAFAVPAALLCYEGFYPRYLALLIFIMMLENFGIFCFFLREGGIISVIHRGFCMLYIENFCRHTVKEISVMRDDGYRMRICAQMLLEPVERIGIEMVCRLIQQENIGLREEQTDERQPRAFTARQSFYGDIASALAKAEFR